jgi:hypothetical protein
MLSIQFQGPPKLNQILSFVFKIQSSGNPGVLSAKQGCQMFYFQTKNTNFGTFWRVFQWKMMVYFRVIWRIIQPFGTFCGHLVFFIVIWYIFPVLVCYKKKNLATLAQNGSHSIGHDQFLNFPTLFPTLCFSAKTHDTISSFETLFLA